MHTATWREGLSLRSDCAATTRKRMFGFIID